MVYLSGNKVLELLDIIFVGIQMVNRTRYGVILLIQILLGKNVIQLLLLFLITLMISQTICKSDFQAEEEGKETKANPGEKSMLK